MTSVEEVRAASRLARLQGRSIGFVPTMGSLHEGHLSLVRQARAQTDHLVVSIYVNPTQFDLPADFDSYPHDVDRDVALCRRAGADVVWTPASDVMYPPGYATYVAVEGLTDVLCGASRPGHFRGVTTIVTKLFHAVEPDRAFFGDKDYQQLLVVRRMSADLDMPVEVVGLPIVREPDGVAMSSRNSHLAPDERAAATCLSRGLAAARRAWVGGERRSRALEAAASAPIEAEPLARFEYAQVRDAGDLSPVDVAEGPVVLAVAALIGAARLIDNVVMGRVSSGPV